MFKQLHLFFGRFCLRRIRIEPDFVPVSSAKQLPCRNSVGFTNQIPESHFHSTYASCLTGWSSELLYTLEYHFHITWIHAKNTTFQHECITDIGSISHFPQTVNTLIGINSYNCRTTQNSC